MSLKQSLVEELHKIGREAETMSISIASNIVLPKVLVDKLKKTGIFTIWVAESYGGSHSHVLDLMEAVQILAHYNGALDWGLSVTCTAGLASGYAVNDNWVEANEGDINKETKSKLRLAASYAVQEAVGIVESANKIGSGSSIWNGVKLQELLRNIHVVSQHGMVSDHNIEIAGRIEFGLDVNEWLL